MKYFEISIDFFTNEKNLDKYLPRFHLENCSQIINV